MQTKFETISIQGEYTEIGYFSELNRERGNKLYVGCSAQQESGGIEYNPTYNRVFIGISGKCDWAEYHAAREKARTIAQRRFSELLINEREKTGNK